jgi:hypothetical protein
LEAALDWRITPQLRHTPDHLVGLATTATLGTETTATLPIVLSASAGFPL